MTSAPLSAASRSRPPQNILVIRGGAIGDFIVTLPALRALRTAFPLAHITLACYPRVLDLALEAGLADRGLSLDLPAFARMFRPPDAGEEPTPFLRDADLVLSYLHDPDGFVAQHLRAGAGGRVIVGSPLVAAGHAVEALMAPLAELGISPAPGMAPELPLSASVLVAGKTLARTFGPSVVALHPGSGSARKNWPLPRFVALADCLAALPGTTPVFILGEAEARLADTLSRRASISQLPLREVAGFLAACSAYVGNDSGISHLAAAVNTPVVALFGPSDPALWAPRSRCVTVIRANPPSEEGLAALPVEHVTDALSRSLERCPPTRQ